MGTYASGRVTGSIFGSGDYSFVGRKICPLYREETELGEPIAPTSGRLTLKTGDKGSTLSAAAAASAFLAKSACYFSSSSSFFLSLKKS